MADECLKFVYKSAAKCVHVYIWLHSKFTEDTNGNKHKHKSTNKNGAIARVRILVEPMIPKDI